MREVWRNALEEWADFHGTCPNRFIWLLRSSGSSWGVSAKTTTRLTITAGFTCTNRFIWLLRSTGSSYRECLIKPHSLTTMRCLCHHLSYIREADLLGIRVVNVQSNGHPPERQPVVIRRKHVWSVERLWVENPTTIQTRISKETKRFSRMVKGFPVD